MIEKMGNTHRRFFTNEKERDQFNEMYERSKAILLAAIQEQFEKDYPKDETMVMVEEFHRVFEIPNCVNQPPHIPTPELSLLRIQCLVEEVGELAHGLAKGDLVEVLDALCDIQYFVDGAFLMCGLERLKLAAMKEVHRSNMTKLDDNGQPIKDEAGRVVKSSNYSKPNLSGVLDEYLCRTQSKHLKEQKRQLFGLLYGINHPGPALAMKEHRSIRTDRKKAEPVLAQADGACYPETEKGKAQQLVDAVRKDRFSHEEVMKEMIKTNQLIDAEGFPGGDQRAGYKITEKGQAQRFAAMYDEVRAQKNRLPEMPLDSKAYFGGPVVADVEDEIMCAAKEAFHETMEEMSKGEDLEAGC